MLGTKERRARCDRASTILRFLSSISNESVKFTLAKIHPLMCVIFSHEDNRILLLLSNLIIYPKMCRKLFETDFQKYSSKCFEYQLAIELFFIYQNKDTKGHRCALFFMSPPDRSGDILFFPVRLSVCLSVCLSVTNRVRSIT